MNQFGTQHRACGEDGESLMKVVAGLGMALFICGIFIPGAGNLLMVGLALFVISCVV
jgi:hypothetical protein